MKTYKFHKLFMEMFAADLTWRYGIQTSQIVLLISITLKSAYFLRIPKLLHKTSNLKMIKIFLHNLSPCILAETALTLTIVVINCVSIKWYLIYPCLSLQPLIYWGVETIIYQPVTFSDILPTGCQGVWREHLRKCLKSLSGWWTENREKEQHLDWLITLSIPTGVVLS